MKDWDSGNFKYQNFPSYITLLYYNIFLKTHCRSPLWNRIPSLVDQAVLWELFYARIHFNFKNVELKKEEKFEGEVP